MVVSNVCVLCLTVFIAEDICLAVLSVVVLFVMLCRSIVSWVYVILPSAFTAVSSRLSEVSVLRGWAVCRLAESRGFGFCVHLSGLLLDRLKTCGCGGSLWWVCWFGSGLFPRFAGALRDTGLFSAGVLDGDPCLALVVCNQQHVGGSDVSPVLVVVMQVFCPFWWVVF